MFLLHGEREGRTEREGCGGGKKVIYQKSNSGCAILSCFKCPLKSCLYIPEVLLCPWNIEHRATSTQLSKKQISRNEKAGVFQTDTSGRFDPPVPRGAPCEHVRDCQSPTGKSPGLALLSSPPWQRCSRCYRFPVTSPSHCSRIPAS